jgi:hypothetical protein
MVGTTLRIHTTHDYFLPYKPYDNKNLIKARTPNNINRTGDIATKKRITANRIEPIAANTPPMSISVDLIISI